MKTRHLWARRSVPSRLGAAARSGSRGDSGFPAGRPAPGGGRLSVLALTAWIACTLVFPQSLSTPADLVLAGKWADACSSRAEIGSDPVDVWIGAHACLASGDYAEAFRTFQSLSDPKVLSQLLNWSEALCREHPDSGVAWMFKGDAEARLRRFEVSLQSLSRALDLDGDNSRIQVLRGVVRILAGRGVEAAEDLEKARRSEGAAAEAAYGLGVLSLWNNQTSLAVEWFSQALEEAPELAAAYNGRGVALALLEDWEQASADLRAAAELDPSLDYVENNRALLAWLASQSGLARKLWVSELGARGTEILAASSDHYSSDLGAGRTIDVFTVRPTPAMATMDGAREWMRTLNLELRKVNLMPEDWTPLVHLDVPGLGATPAVQRGLVARAAFASGADVIVQLDLRPLQSAAVGQMDVGTAARAALFLARVASAVNLETRHPPNLTAFARGAEVVSTLRPSGGAADSFGSAAQGLRFGNLVLSAGGAQSAGLDPWLLGRIQGRVLELRAQDRSLQPVSSTGKVFQLPSQFHGAPALGGDRAALTALPMSSLELAVGALRGWDVDSLRNISGQRLSGLFPAYSAPAAAPISQLVSLTSEIRRNLFPEDRVLIGSKDLDQARKVQGLIHPFSSQIRPVVDANGLQSIARREQFTKIILLPERSSAREAPLVGVESRSGLGVRHSLPEFRELRESLSKTFQAVSLAAHVTGDPFLEKLKMAGDPLKMFAAVLHDGLESNHGRFSLARSHSVEQAASIFLDMASQKTLGGRPLIGLHGADGVVASISSAMGRGYATVDEITRLFDSVSQMATVTAAYSWGVTRGMSHQAAVKFAEGIGTAQSLALPKVRDATFHLFENQRSVRQQMISMYDVHLQSAEANRIQARTLEQMYTGDLLRKVGFSSREIASYNQRAAVQNSILASYSKAGSGVGLTTLQRPLRQFEIDLDQSVPGRRNDVLLSINSPLPGVPGRPGPGGALVGSSASGRGGVLMSAEVVKNRRADFSQLLGGEAKPSAAPPDSFFVPLLFYPSLMSSNNNR